MTKYSKLPQRLALQMTTDKVKNYVHLFFFFLILIMNHKNINCLVFQVPGARLLSMQQNCSHMPSQDQLKFIDYIFYTEHRTQKILIAKLSGLI